MVVVVAVASDAGDVVLKALLATPLFISGWPISTWAGAALEVGIYPSQDAVVAQIGDERRVPSEVTLTGLSKFAAVALLFCWLISTWTKVVKLAGPAPHRPPRRWWWNLVINQDAVILRVRDVELAVLIHTPCGPLIEVALGVPLVGTVPVLKLGCPRPRRRGHYW